MLSKIQSLGLNGIDGLLVTAECDVSGGLPAFEIVGLPDAAVKEARERVRSAIKNSGFEFPLARITVNLAPADIKKEAFLPNTWQKNIRKASTRLSPTNWFTAVA